MAKSAREFVIFYAWQSDTPSNGNRYLIAEALDKACEKLRADPTIGYTITVTSDTAGEPGMCDIPAVILKKIDASDAVVLDLTYVAKTDRKEKPKYCPNPNVLFELGYAFRAITPERLICVMNEAYGKVDETLFDVNHRRHPVKYTTAEQGKARSKVIDELADSIASALKPTVQLGPRSSIVDSGKAFELQSSNIRHHWESKTTARKGPIVFFKIRPSNFVERRWPSIDALEEQLQARQLPALEGSHYFPPRGVNDDRMPWGLYNGTYTSVTWSLCYSGQFWAAIYVAAQTALDLNVNRVFPTADEPRAEPVIPIGEWINYPHALTVIANVFRFASSLAQSYHPLDELIWNAVVEGMSNTVLAATDAPLEISRNCAAPYAVSHGIAAAETFTAKWTDYCLDFFDEFFGSYEIHGTYIRRQTHQARLDRLVRQTTRQFGLRQ